jgi:hypothetical protein
MLSQPARYLIYICILVTITVYNIKSFNIFLSTQFNQDLQIKCVAKPASSQLIELIESSYLIQFNIEGPLIDLQAWGQGPILGDTQTSTLDLIS